MKISTPFKAIPKNNCFITKLFLLLLILTNSSSFSFAQQANMSKLSVQLLLNLKGGPQNTADGLVAVFADNFSKKIGNEDSYKFTNLDENIAINRDGVNLSIEG